MMFVMTAFSTVIAQDGQQQVLSVQSVLEKFEDDEHNDLQSVIVIQNNELVGEKYYNGSESRTLVDIRSAGKSITSLLFGIAVDQKFIESLEDPVEKYWKEAKDKDIGSVRIKDLLTMRSGLDADANNPDSQGNEDNMDESKDPLTLVLNVPNKEEPGTRYRYNSHAAYTVGVIISNAVDQDLEEFAKTNLFNPLGITQWYWMEDLSGQTKGQGNLFLSAPDLARIGNMVLNKGLHNNQQIVSSAWIEESLTPKVDVSAFESNAVGYGYYWFYQEQSLNGKITQVYFASGNGGNKIYVVPELHMVVTILSRAYGHGYGHRRSESILKSILEIN